MASTSGNDTAKRAKRKTVARKRTITALQITLKNAFTIYENDVKLKEDPARWIEHIIHGLHRARCLLDQRRNHPELNGVFEQLEMAAYLAERRLPVFAEHKGIVVTSNE